jgi:hypothetical protein
MPAAFLIHAHLSVCQVPRVSEAELALKSALVAAVAEVALDGTTPLLAVPFLTALLKKAMSGLVSLSPSAKVQRRWALPALHSSSTLELSHRCSGTLHFGERAWAGRGWG